LDRGRMICNLVPVADGDEFELSRERVVTVFDTVHTVPSVGYLVWDRRRKLKEDLVGAGEDEIRKRRLGGEDVTREVRMPLVCYCGDTAPAGLDNYDPVFQSRVLITEMTFFRPDHRKDKIHKFGHTHLDDIIERAERFENELIILAHFSTRYHEGQIRREVKKRLPESLRDRVELWI
ncbi:MAG TPA: metal-dependent hydrolase, partial [Planctomycetaceae bacterium]|nr:metal-dependent hydrolase [Planctomycetaceae bacterium]